MNNLAKSHVISCFNISLFGFELLNLPPPGRNHLPVAELPGGRLPACVLGLVKRIIVSAFNLQECCFLFLQYPFSYRHGGTLSIPWSFISIGVNISPGPPTTCGGNGVGGGY